MDFAKIATSLLELGGGVTKVLPLFGSPFPIETNNSEAAADWKEILHIFCEE